MRKIAAIYPKGDKFVAKMLFENSTTPVEYYFIADEIMLIYAHITLDFMNLEVVDRFRFNLELDHIKLFGCRSTDRLIARTNDKVTDQDVIDFLTK